MRNKALIDLIDYLLEDYGGDCCAKCSYYKPVESGDIPPCKPIEQDGNVACRNGMIKYFTNMCNAHNLTCKVGDTVYQVDNGGQIYESKIKGLIYDCGHIAFDERAIGKTIFLTREEAQQRLKEE